MKKSILTFSGIFLACLFFALNATAQTIQVSGKATSFELIESSDEHLVIQNTLSRFNHFEVNTQNGEFTEFVIPGYGTMMEPGKPKLPVMKKLIEVPYGCEYEISFNSISYETVKLSDYNITNPLFPFQPSVSKSIDNPGDLPFHLNEEVYNNDEFFGQEPVKVVDLGVIRGVRIARLEIAPFQYNPVTGELNVFNDIDCNINFKGADIQRTNAEKAKGYSPWFEANYKQLINHNPSQARELIEYAPVTYIIVSDPMFETALQPFINWKTKKGFKVVEAYTDDPSVGSTTTTIKSYLQNFYNNPPAGYNPQSFVLIVGDVAQIPAFSGTAGSHVTDLYYCEYTGDKLPECYYGRFSATNLTQLQPQIDKTLEYEQYTFPDASFLDEVVMVAGADSYHQLTWGNGQINYGTTYYFNVAHGLTSHVYLQPEPSGGNYSANIRQDVSNGVSYANYSAHCSASGWADPNFSISHIGALQNAHKYPLMVGNCCLSVKFEINCFGEEILRAANKGAIGYIGGSNSTYWDEDFWWGVGYESVATNPTYHSQNLGAYDRTFHDRTGITLDDWFITQGQMPSAGNLAVTQAGSSLTTYYWEIYHLMGDPSLMVYLSQAPDISVSYPALMPLGAETFTVTTDPYAYVAISKDGILHGAALADASGEAIVQLDPISTAGTADVVVTKQNGKPFIGTVEVSSPGGIFISLEEVSISDPNGNNNGMADYGENVLLNVSLENIGDETANNISASISTADAFAEVVTSSHNWPEIPAGEIILENGAFEVLLANDIPDLHQISFNMEITDGASTWNATFKITGHAPDLSMESFTILDSGGNNNGRLDPGETANFIINIENSGSAGATNVLGELTSTDSYITINTNDPQSFGNVAAGNGASASFQLSVSTSCPAGHSAAFAFQYTADHGIGGSDNFTSIIGQNPVLIVDLDENNNSANEIESAINALCISSDFVTSVPDNLELYASVFVCLGIYADNHVLSSTEGQKLADYLNGGGMLYMEGGDTWAYDATTAVHGMFGINGTSDGSGDLGTILGQSNTITEGMSFVYTGQNVTIDQLEATGTGEVILQNSLPSYATAIINDAGTYKTIGVSHEFGGLLANKSSDLMQAYLEFFGLWQSLSANFTADITTVTQDESVQFTNLSIGNPNTYNWIFEGGTPATSSDENPSVIYDTPGTFDVSLTITSGGNSKTEVKQNYITVLESMQSQLITIPAGWSGLSSCLIPEDTDINALLQEVMDDVVILQDMSGVFYPGLGVNTIGQWDSQMGYRIKVANEITLNISGWENPSNELELTAGWNLIPVLSECNVQVDKLFYEIPQAIVLVKEVAGPGIYWPAMNINTLTHLQTGKAYFVRVSEDCTVSFFGCD
jgi:PKD repeat protein